MTIINITNEETQFARQLIEFINDSRSSFHAVYSTKKLLQDQGFKELSCAKMWDLNPGGKYFVTKNDSALIAFLVGEEEVCKQGFRIIGTHTDSPGFHVKPLPEMVTEGNYIKLNVETYGGPILNTWLDRPLSLAGRIILKGESPFKPRTKLFHCYHPLLVIPNISIHLNRKVNEGIELNKQRDMLPLMAQLTEGLEKDGILINLIAKSIKCTPEDIIDFDLYLYEFEKGSLLGLQGEFISSSRMDNLAMVHAATVALANSKPSAATKVLVCLDNEECGSNSTQGADSPFLANTLERISLSQHKKREYHFMALENSFLISADMAQAVHPNAGDRYDPINRPLINCGPVLKLSSNQSYTTNAETAAIFTEICKNAEVPIQKFVNRSDERGGTTIGPIITRHIDIRSVDIGNPLLAMHSVRELAGVKDHLAMAKVLIEFYKYSNCLYY